MKAWVVIASFFAVASLSAAQENYQTSDYQKVKTPKPSLSTTAMPSNANTPVQDRFTTTDDQKIGNNIRVTLAEIIGAPKSNEIIVIVDAGHVKLVGKVPTEDAKAKIGQAIQAIKGVKSLNNRLDTGKKAG